MKKMMLAALAAVVGFAAAATPAQAQAQNYFSAPYVGLEYSRYNVDYNRHNIAGVNVSLGDIAEDSLNGFNLYAGNRFHENFGVEVGYFRTGKESKTVNRNLTPFTGVNGDVYRGTSLRMQGLSLDLLGYMPVAERLELVGSVGGAWTKADLKESAVVFGRPFSGSGDDSELNFRLGGGLEYGLTDSLNLRGMVRWQNADFDGLADNMWSYNIGLNYGF